MGLGVRRDDTEAVASWFSPPHREPAKRTPSYAALQKRHHGGCYTGVVYPVTRPID